MAAEHDKKILYVHTGVWPSPSPSIVFVTGTAYGFSQTMRTVLFVKNGSDDPTEEVFRSLTGYDPPEKLDIVRAGLGAKTPGHAAFYRQALGRVKAMAKEGELAAVITRSVGFLPYLVYCRKRYGIPCFFETHDFFTDLSMRTDLKKNVRIRKNSLYERKCIPRLDGLICLTNPQKELYRKSYPESPIHVAHTGLLHVERRDTRREKLVCYIGSLDEHKGLGTILTALGQTVDKEAGLLVIGGKNEHEMRKFKDFARLMGIENRVRVTGWVHHSDIGHMMDRCIAGVVPLADTPFNRYITSPLKILDCFSRSLPVIGSDLPSIRDYVEDGGHGLLFQPDSPESLSETLDRYIACGMFETMSPKVEQHAMDFLYSRRGESIIAFIDGIIQNRQERK